MCSLANSHFDDAMGAAVERMTTTAVVVEGENFVQMSTKWTNQKKDDRGIFLRQSQMHLSVPK
jgi:hypothetical protein